MIDVANSTVAISFDSSDELEPWLQSAIESFAELLNMFGITDYHVLAEPDELSLPLNGFLPLESDTDAYLVGLAVESSLIVALVGDLSGLTEEGIRQDPACAADGLGELANILAGPVRRNMARDDSPLTIGLPIVGSDMKVHGAVAERRVDVRTDWGVARLVVQRRRLPSEIVEQRRMQRELHHREERLRAIWTTAADGIITVDADGAIESLNPAAATMFGVEPTSVVGTAISELIPDLKSEQLDPQSGDAFSREASGVRIDEGEVPLEISVAPFWIGTKLMRAIVARDLTTRKEAEAQLRRAHVQMTELSRKAGMADVAADVLHGVGNTLNTVNTSVGILRDTVRTSRSGALIRISDMLQKNSDELAAFLTVDQRGKALPRFIAELAGVLSNERARMLDELATLASKVDQIAELIQKQQAHVGTCTILQDVRLDEVVETVLAASAVCLSVTNSPLTEDIRCIIEWESPSQPIRHARRRGESCADSAGTVAQCSRVV